MTLIPSNKSTPATLVCVATDRHPLSIEPSPGSGESFTHVPSPSKAQSRPVTHCKTRSTTCIDLTKVFKDTLQVENASDDAEDADES
jgi:hypothetical protein